MSERIVEITLPYPPSVNSYWGVNPKTGRWYLKPKGRAYKQAVRALIHKLNPLIDYKMLAVIHFYAPDKRVRDADNGLKAVFDCLSGVVYTDDKLVRRIYVDATIIDRDNPRVEIELTPITYDQLPNNVIPFPTE